VSLTRGNIAVRSTDVIKWNWGRLHWKYQIERYQNKDRLPICNPLIWPRKLKTGPHKTFDWAACGPRATGWKMDI